MKLLFPTSPIELSEAIKKNIPAIIKEIPTISVMKLSFLSNTVVIATRIKIKNH